MGVARWRIGKQGYAAGLVHGSGTKGVLGLASHLNRSRQGHRHAHSLGRR
jgi:hypothetical protein